MLTRLQPGDRAFDPKTGNGERDQYDNASCPLHSPESTHAEVAGG